MRFHIVGADRETGSDIELDISATDRAEAEIIATKRGVMVAAVEPIKDPDPEQIEFSGAAKSGNEGTRVAATPGVAPPATAVDPSVARAMASGSLAGKSVAGASTAGKSVAGASAAGASQAGASRAPDSHGSISGTIGGSTSQPGAHMEYHVIMNQSLYLLEVAVNKYLKDGWEPSGGLTVGIWNNAMQYFQAMIRHKD